MKILLAEDNNESRESLTRFLSRLGHEVTSCSDGAEAWQQLEENPHPVVLTDIHMPNLGGQELLQKIKNHDTLRTTDVVLFTGYGNIGSAVEAMRNGATDYLLKPINIEELTILLDRIEQVNTLRAEHQELREQFDEKVGEATRELVSELSNARQEMARLAGSSRIGVYSKSMRELLATAQRLRANQKLPVLIVGETGTGKELMAKYIHYGEEGSSAPFIAINCAAINPNIFESELFGYEAGAFTGGNPAGQEGKLEMANGGSLFLDEISEMSPDLQAKLLRVIQEREFYRVGGVKKLHADLRIIAASNRDLEKLVEQHKFRQDLYFRLNVGMLVLPPLRERREAIPALAEHFLSEHASEGRTHFRSFREEAKAKLLHHSWPGNVRELKNVIDRMVLLHDGDEVLPGHLDVIGGALLSAAQLRANGDSTPALPKEGFDLDEHVLDIIQQALDMHDGNRSRAARYLGISRSAMYTYLKHLEKR